jgi:hypothetical protein
VVVGEGHAPVVAVLLRLLKPLELMSAPKGVGPRHPRTFRLQSGTF